MNTRWAPAKSLQMAFSFSPLVLSLLLSLFAASSISAFSTVTTTRLSSSNSVDSKEEENGSYSWQQFQLRRRRHQKDNCNASASKLSITRLNMSLSSSADDAQQGTTLDVSSYISPMDDDDDNNNETKDYVMQQTMIRVKNPIQSLDFYCKILGFRLIHFSEFPQWKFNVYFVAPISALASSSSTTIVPSTRPERWQQCMTTPGCIELTWNYGTEKEEGSVYNTGNADGTGITIIASTSNSSSSTEEEAAESIAGKVRGGFGHLGITVPNVYEACARFHSLGVNFHKSPNMGGMKGLAFIKDPDGYLIEVLPQGPLVVQDIDCLGVKAAIGDGMGYTDNSK